MTYFKSIFSNTNIILNRELSIYRSKIILQVYIGSRNGQFILINVQFNIILKKFVSL